MPTKLPRKPPLFRESLYLAYDDVLLLPQYSDVSPPEVSYGSFLTEKVFLEAPLIASPMDTVCGQEMALALSQLGGLGIIHRNLSIEEQGRQFTWVKENGGTAGVAVGVGADFQARLSHLKACGANLFCIDSAHGHSKQIIAATAYIKDHYADCEVISGNVATYEGAKALFEAGADSIRVGIGPGSICSTRIVAGVGVPQFSALLDCAAAAQEHKKTVIADGGIKISGDIVKALAAGGAAAMLGFLLAGTEEALGVKIEKQGKTYKAYRGMGSPSAMKLGSAARYGLEAKQAGSAPQGVEGRVPYKGPVRTYIESLLDGLRAGMAYIGAKNILQLQEKACFIQQSHAAYRESHPHSIEGI